MKALSQEEYQATFFPPMLDVTESAEEIVDLWGYADAVIEQRYHSCTAWEWYVKNIYETQDGQFQHLNIPVPLNNTYLVVVVDKPKREILGHYVLDLHPDPKS